jgi:chromosome segregation ATPase
VVADAAVPLLLIWRERRSHDDLLDLQREPPRYDFGDAIEFKMELERLRRVQAEMAKDGHAARCSTEWHVSGSRAEGRKTTDKILKLMLRAFNGESDALIVKVKYSNVQSYEERIRKSCEQINKLGSGFHCAITEEFLRLKLEELYRAYRYQEKIEDEKEEQRRIREQMREEERVQKDIEKAVKDAEKEHDRFDRALDKARNEVAAAEGARREKLMAQISELEQRLREADEKQQRATSIQARCSNRVPEVACHRGGPRATSAHTAAPACAASSAGRDGRGIGSGLRLTPSR